MPENYKKPVIYETGTIMFKLNINDYVRWFDSLDADAAGTIKSHILSEYVYKNEHIPSIINERVLPRYWVPSTVQDMFSVNSWASYPPEATREAKWPKQRAAWVERILQFISFSKEYSIPVKVGFWQEGLFAYLYLGNLKSGIIIYEPEQWLDYIPAPDFSDVTVAEASRMLCGGTSPIDVGIIPAEAKEQLTTGAVKSKLEEQNDLIAKTKKIYDETQRCETGELAEMKAAIEKMQRELNEKKWALMEELEQKLEAFEEQKFELENQIFLLDSQIYSIMCYTGEIVKFTAIRTGKDADMTEPLVIHQKLRFLDEELGTLASIYQIDWDDIKMFEHFLRHHPLALDVFAPDEKCVTLVRLSKTGTILGESTRWPWQNVLEEYEYYHGKTVGVIIRNGENLYLGWTDETRVHIKDDFIVTQNQVVTETTPYEEPKFHFKSDREAYINKQRQDKRDLMDGVVSRLFVYNILQGVVDNTPILKLPDGVKLNKQSDYVIYSVADKWVSDNRFDFTEIIRRCNERVQVGDMLLTTQHLVAERKTGWSGGYVSQSWHNDRGVGDKNRTHDVYIDDCTLYPANKVEYGSPETITKYKYKYRKPTNGPTGLEFEDVWINAETRNKDGLGKDCEILGSYEYIPRHVYVSEEKENSRWRADWTGGKVARANFELDDKEFINCTYLCSTWLKWVIANRKLGGWRVAGHEVDFAHAIRYLKTAMDYVREREVGEKAHLDAIDPHICKDPEWPLKLTEWKMSNGVRSITAYQAKRYAKAISEGY